MTDAQFEAVVREALDLLPAPLREVFDRQCVVIIEEWADRETLRSLGSNDPGDTPYGLYTGVPYGERRTLIDTGTATPDIITIYRGPLMEDFETREEMVEEIRITLLHELGHALGFDEEDLEERGLA